MSHIIKDINTKNHTYYPLDDIFIIDPKNIEIDKKSYKNILIYYIGYVTIKKDPKIYSGNPLCIVFNKVNGSVEEISRVFNASSF